QRRTRRHRPNVAVDRRRRRHHLQLLNNREEFIMSTLSHPHPSTAVRSIAPLRTGSALMAVAGLAFIGYAVMFFIQNFTDSFLEVGIGQDQVNVGRTDIEQFSPSLA